MLSEESRPTFVGTVSLPEEILQEREHIFWLKKTKQKHCHTVIKESSFGLEK